LKVAHRPQPVFSTVDAVEEAFYDALNRGDVVGMMSLWSDDDDCVCVHPSGDRYVGTDAIKASWDLLLAQGGIPISPRSRRSYMGAVLVVHNLVEELQMPPERGSEIVSFIVTNVYSRSPKGWRILMHQSVQTSQEQACLERARNETIH
jgi:ketosteroid isomerase-like protein